MWKATKFFVQVLGSLIKTCALLWSTDWVTSDAISNVRNYFMHLCSFYREKINFVHLIFHLLRLRLYIHDSSWWSKTDSENLLFECILPRKADFHCSWTLFETRLLTKLSLVINYESSQLIIYDSQTYDKKPCLCGQ